MSNQRPFTATGIGLIAAVAVPFLYFGAQLAAAPFYPGYSFLSNSASMLGSDRSTRPPVLNAGAFITGVATLLAAYEFFRSLILLDTKPILIWLVALSVISTGVASIWASQFHLHDPRIHSHWGCRSISVASYPLN